MKKIVNILLFVVVSCMVLQIDIKKVSALTIDISANQDVFLYKKNPANNFSFNNKYLWVGYYNSYMTSESVFGFNLTSLTGLLKENEDLTINSIEFNAFHNYNKNSNEIKIALGKDDSWVDSSLTWNSGHGNYGDFLDTKEVSHSTLNNWVTWDISTISVDELMDNYLTIYLLPNENYSWNDFEAEEYLGNNESFLKIDYNINLNNINITAVPESGTILLLSVGFLALFISKRFMI